MNKYLKWGIIVAIGLAAALYIAYLLMIRHTKSFSPEETITYNQNDYNIEVYYNRPYKKGRKIFGGLVPFGKVWRTGANEATTFKSQTDLTIDGKPLKAGKYTLWTIPDADTWTVIFNSEQYAWGVNSSGASRDEEYDVMQVRVTVASLPEVVEQFTIALDGPNDKPALSFSWDQTRVSVPLE